MPRSWQMWPPRIFSFANSISNWIFRRRALASRKESLDLTKTLEEHGINSILDVRQAEQLVYTAAAEIADLNRRIAQQENFLSILMGNNPGPIEPRGKELVDQPHPPMVPAGLPSALLERGRTFANRKNCWWRRMRKSAWREQHISQIFR